MTSKITNGNTDSSSAEQLASEDPSHSQETPRIDSLLSTAQDGSSVIARRSALLEIAGLKQSSLHLAAVLYAIKETDSDAEIRRLAEQALAAPVHRALMQQNRDAILQESAALIHAHESEQSALRIERSKIAVTQKVQEEAREKPKRERRQYGFGCLIVGIILILLPGKFAFVLAPDIPLGAGLGVVLLLIGIALLTL
jgi:hypothetical protein